MARRLLIVLIIATFIDSDFAEAGARQKRCIVIQKQSGTHGDSSEDDGGNEEYRKPQLKEPSDRLRRPTDTENISPELLKYKIRPMKRTREDRLRNRFFKKYL